MPVLQRLATAKEQESLGHLQELTSPVLGKLKEALIFTRLAYAQRRAFGARTHVLDGIAGSKMHVGWFEESRLLVMAYNNPSCDLTVKQPSAAHSAVRWTHTVSPPWLTAVAPGAAVHNVVANIFDSLADGSEGIAEVIKTVTEGVTPRRITCVGYCLGGAVATLTALFAALQCPTADVRCITFGSQYAGNAAFAEAFRWLVGTSFRVVYRKDPIPAFKHKSKLLHGHLVHVHGEIFIDDGAVMSASSQPLGHQLNGDAQDHCLEKYAEAIHGLCLAHMERDQAAGGNMLARFAMCYLKMTGLDQGKPQSPAQGAGAGPQPGEWGRSAASQESQALKTAQGEGEQEEGSHQVPDKAKEEESCVEDGTDKLRQKWSEGPIQLDLNSEKAMQCGKVLLERALLGEPLPEDESSDLAKMQTQQADVSTHAGHAELLSSGSSGEADDTMSTSSSGAFVAAALGDDNLRASAAQQTQRDERRSNVGQAGSVLISAQAQQASGAPPNLNQPSAQHAQHEQAAQISLDQAPGQQTNFHEAQQAAPAPSASSSSGRDQEQHREGGGRPWLKRAFSLVERENLNVDYESMNSLDKVLVTGKISQAVVVAAAAYRDTEEFQARTGLTNSKLIDDEFHTNTHVHVAWLEGGTAVLAFRGTQTAQDGLQDVKIVRQSIDHLSEMFPGTRAHTGFMQQFAAVCRPGQPDKNMGSVIEQLSGGKTPTRVLCCGHSLGGALATLGATWAALQYPMADIRCITFGSPRVGNKAFKRAFHTLVGTSLRLVHGGDPIPVLPPAFVYHHVSGAIHLENGHIKLKARPWLHKLRPNVADHMITRYNAGIYFQMPGGLEAMPLPRPDKKNMQRLSTLYAAQQGKGGALDKLSDTSQATRSSEDEAINKQVAPDLMRESVGCTIWHMFGCGGSMHTDVKDEGSDSGEDSVHATAPQKPVAVAV